MGGGSTLKEILCQKLPATVACVRGNFSLMYVGHKRLSRGSRLRRPPIMCLSCSHLTGARVLFHERRKFYAQVMQSGHDKII